MLRRYTIAETTKPLNIQILGKRRPVLDEVEARFRFFGQRQDAPRLAVARAFQSRRPSRLRRRHGLNDLATRIPMRVSAALG